MNETPTISINRQDSLQNRPELLNILKDNTRFSFSALYDQYAPLLLGIITKIVGNEIEAAALLEETFIQIRSQINDYKPEKQPLFIWLLAITRCTAIDALNKRKPKTTPVLLLTTLGQVISPSSQTNPSSPTTVEPVNLQLKRLLDTVLFKNCTPEEAASSLDMSPESARQQLRLAMLQVRASQ